jgi:hypothetical protein
MDEVVARAGAKLAWMRRAAARATARLRTHEAARPAAIRAHEHANLALLRMNNLAVRRRNRRPIDPLVAAAHQRALEGARAARVDPVDLRRAVGQAKLDIVWMERRLRWLVEAADQMEPAAPRRLGAARARVAVLIACHPAAWGHGVPDAIVERLVRLSAARAVLRRAPPERRPARTRRTEGEA